MINKVFQDYLEEVNNIDSNYKKIISKKRGVVNMKNYKKKILNIVAIFVAIVFIGVASTQIYAKIQWDIKFKEYQNRPIGEAKGSLQEAKEAGYAEDVEMDYITQNGISIKVDSILLTDDCFDANISFKFDDNIVVDSESFTYGYAVYDESNNIYNINGRMHMNPNEKYDTVTPFIYKELGIKYNKKDIYSVQLADRSGISNVESNIENKSIVTNVTLRAEDSFPRSKKIYIRVFDLGYTMMDIDLGINDPDNRIRNVEDFKLSDAEWIFEIDVPDKFYERKTLELKIKDEIPDLEINKITLTEAGLVLNFKSKTYTELICAGKDMKGNEFSEATSKMLSITDGEGKTYQDLGGGTTREENGYKMILDAGKKDLDKKLYINFNGYTSELVEK